MHFRDRFFPIYSGSFVKFFLLASLCFLVCTNYTILRNIKDTLVITQPEMGVQVIPFLRTWFLIPCMLIFVKGYAFLSARYTQSTVCYSFLGLFFLYFFAFIFLFTPFANFFLFHSIANFILSFHLPFLEPIAEILRHWTFSLYYCLSEIWGTVVILILFWGTSNRSTNLEEAKRFYSPLLLVGNLSGMAASHISLAISRGQIKYLLFPNEEEWNATFLSLTLIVCIFTLIVIGLFFYLHHFVLKNREENTHTKASLEKAKMKLIPIIREIGANKKFLPLAIMIFAYFFTSGTMEIVWKFYLHQAFPNPNAFNDFLSQSTVAISIGSTFLVLFITGSLIRKFSWRLSAIITPLVLLIPLLFFTLNFLFYQDSPAFLLRASFLGAAYYCSNRICKFTFFDLSKEVASVEFSYEEQIKSKTVLDGLIPKIGKTSESLFLQMLFISIADFQTLLPVVLITVFIMHGIWAYFIPLRKKALLPQ